MTVGLIGEYNKFGGKKFNALIVLHQFGSISKAIPKRRIEPNHFNCYLVKTYRHVLKRNLCKLYAVSDATHTI
jgi:hypothetical protein